MPVVRYIVWVGASLLALLLVANWCLPEPSQEAAHQVIEKPVIRIAWSSTHPVHFHRYQSADDRPAANAVGKHDYPEAPSLLQSLASVNRFRSQSALTKRNQKVLNGGRQRLQCAALHR